MWFVTYHESCVTKKIYFIQILLNLYCDKRRDIQWNIALAQGKPGGRSPRDFLRAQAMFHRISQHESQYRHSQLQLEHVPSWRSILEELIIHIAPTAEQYRKIFVSRLRNTGKINFNIIMFSIWEWYIHGQLYVSYSPLFTSCVQ